MPMCGRYVLYGPHSRYREQFGTDDDFDLPPRFNIAPAQVLPVVRQRQDGRREFVMARWGLLPSWVKDPAERHHPINAKAETAAILPMFRRAFRQSRVLVPADGFYEWKTVAGGKQPYMIRLKGGAAFAMAGLLEHWQGPAGEVDTFAVLTTDANPLVGDIHARMPAIIPLQDYGRWLDPAFADVAVLQALLTPFSAQLMETYPVSRKVGNPANEGPELIEPEAN